jgi:very-short-patch-repair endonuclease
MKFIYNNQNLKPIRRVLRKNQTDAEKVMWNQLRNRRLEGFRFVRQYSVGRYVLDFYCPKARVGIELDGSQHADEEVKEYDDQRTNELNSLGIEVLRFWNNDIYENLEKVLEKIYNKLINSIQHDTNNRKNL